MAQLEILDDQAILDYTTEPNGKGRVLTDSRDLNLRYTPPRPIPGGVYDVEIFGSPMSDRCICGKIRKTSNEPCPFCGAKVYTVEEGLRRFARIELPFYYLNELRFDIFKQFFDLVFQDTKITLNFADSDLRAGGYSQRAARKLGIKVFDSCQFDYNPKKKELVISEFITDEAKCSYEGLLKIITEHFPDRKVEYERLINRYYLVQPSMMRPFAFTIKGGKKLQVSHKLSVWYSAIIRLCCVQDENSGSENYKFVMESMASPGERVRYTALLRALLNVGKKEATELLNSSKENLARGLYSVRTKNSARCPIIPSTTLPIDEVSIPRHIAYEMCRSGFCDYLVKELNFTKAEAARSTRDEYDNPEIQKLFKEYAEKQYVIINRQPTLSPVSMFCMKLRLNDETPIDSITGKEGTGEIYSMALPIAVCSPLNADFDGDTMSMHLVPPEVAEETYNLMSPRYENMYQKSNEPIYVPNHETLNGLAVASEVVYDDPKELDDPKHFYTDYAELLRDVEINKTIKIGTPIVFTGKIGSEDYQSKITTYGRLRLSKIIDADIDKIGIFSKPFERISAKSGAKLYQYLYQFPDGVEKINALQKYALLVVTKAGVVTFDFKTLWVDSDTETYQEICRIADSPDYSDKQKLLMMNELYKKFLKEMEGQFSDDLKDELKRANRVKLASIIEMVAPSLIISGIDEKPIINRHTLVNGMTEHDFRLHATENRSLQSIKVMGVPSSGYLTRQLSFLMNNYKYELGEDPENKCIMIPRYKALGRVDPDGKRYSDKEISRPSEDDLVPVRSIITKFKDKDIVTPDLIGSKFKDITPGAGIGLSFGTSLTENITQSALGLKHGGHERVIDENCYLYAPRACKVREEGIWMYLDYKGGSLKYPRPDNLVLNAKESFDKGDLIGAAYSTTSPIYRLNALIKLMNARGSDGTRYFERDNVIISDCYAYEEGDIHYETNPRTGKMEVRIGSVKYDYNPQCMYFFPEGAHVKKLERFCSGVVNMYHVINDLGSNIRDIYLIFRKQFYYLTDGTYRKTGITELSAPQEELVEMLFISLINVDYNPKKDQIENIDYLGTYSGVMNNDSFYTILSYGWSGRVVKKALQGEAGLKNDLMTETVLGLLLNDKLDDPMLPK